MQGTNAFVGECAVLEPGGFYDAKTGQRVGQWGTGGTKGYRITMVLQNGIWTFNYSQLTPSECP